MRRVVLAVTMVVEFVRVVTLGKVAIQGLVVQLFVVDIVCVRILRREPRERRNRLLGT